VRNRNVQGTSIVEAMCFGMIALIVLGVLVSLFASAMRQDTWNGERLDALAAVGSTLDRLRRDLLESSSGRTIPEDNALELQLGPPDGASTRAVYGWSGPGTPLKRNGKAIGFSRPLDFGVRVDGGTAVFWLTVPSSMRGGDARHETTISVPLVVPDAYWRGRYHFYARRA
jgi:hypothetical protein